MPHSHAAGRGPAAGWTLNSASNINDSDEIVGWATRTGGGAETRHAYRLKLPSANAIECAGRLEGAACNDHDACTQTAIDAQVFGAPWFVYRGEPFWGQDRLDFLARALSK